MSFLIRVFEKVIMIIILQ